MCQAELELLFLCIELKNVVLHLLSGVKKMFLWVKLFYSCFKTSKKSIFSCIEPSENVF